MKLTAITRIYDQKWEKMIKIDEGKNSCPMQCLILCV